MSGAFPGGFITKSPTATVGPSGDFSEGGTASGMWTLDQALALKSAGLWPGRIKDRYLWAWGKNENGLLGDNTVTYRSSPVQIGAQTNWSSIALGVNHNLALKPDGTMWSWGPNGVAQLGQNDTVYRSSPTQIGSLTTWSKIAAGSAFSIAIKTDGTMWSWGTNSSGHLGINSNIGVFGKSSPTQIGALTTWSDIRSGNEHTLAIKTDGTLWAWGSNDKGRIGDNTNPEINRSSPVQIGALTTWSKTSASGYSMAIKTDGTLWAWGNNDSGQLGDGTKVYRSSPVQIGALTTWSQINAGGSGTAAIKTDGTMWMWGYNGYGSLGDNTTISKSSPIQLGALTTWSVIAGTAAHIMAIKTAGTLWLWGSNYQGQLGDNKLANVRSSPVQLSSLTTWTKIAGNTGRSMAIVVV